MTTADLPPSELVHPAGDLPLPARPSLLTADRPKIAHIATTDGTVHYLLLSQLRRLQECGYEVVAISSPGGSVAAIRAAGVRHIAVPMHRGLSPLMDVRSLVHLGHVIRRESFAIVHTHTPKAGLLGQLAAKASGVPIVVNTLHGFYFHERMHPAERRLYIALEKLAARCSDVILSQNREDIATALREGISPPGRIKHLGNGIDLTQFDPGRFTAEDVAARRRQLRIPEGCPVVGFVGRLAAVRKGFLDFMAAGAMLARDLPEIRFLIAGLPDRGKRDAVEPTAAAGYGISRNCVFVGQRPNHEMPLLYRVMDVLVLPSLFEGMPRAVMEACAMQVPAVVSNVKGNREVVEQGRNGLRVPFGAVERLANAVAELLSDPGKARSMGRQGRRMALERFDERLVFDRVLSEYSRLLEEKLQPCHAGALDGKGDARLRGPHGAESQ